MKIGKKDIDLIEVGKLALLGTGIYLLYKFFFAKSEGETESEKLVKLQEQEIKKYSKIYKTTYDLPFYIALANAIYESIKHSGVADDYAKTFQLMLKIKNPLEMAYVIKFYGVRQRYTLGVPTGTPADLITSVSDELRSESIYNPFQERKYDQINKIYAQRNIKYAI
jgi:hypothetical protein